MTWSSVTSEYSAFWHLARVTARLPIKTLISIRLLMLYWFKWQLDEGQRNVCQQCPLSLSAKNVLITHRHAWPEAHAVLPHQSKCPFVPPLNLHTMMDRWMTLLDYCCESATLPTLFSTSVCVCVTLLSCVPVPQRTRQTPVSSWPATSSRAARSMVGRARPSVCATPATSPPPPAAGTARAPAPCGPTTAWTTACARSSRDTALLASTTVWMNDWICAAMRELMKSCRNRLMQRTMNTWMKYCRGQWMNEWMCGCGNDWMQDYINDCTD